MTIPLHKFIYLVKYYFGVESKEIGETPLTYTQVLYEAELEVEELLPFLIGELSRKTKTFDEIGEKQVRATIESVELIRVDPDHLVDGITQVDQFD